MDVRKIVLIIGITLFSKVSFATGGNSEFLDKQAFSISKVIDAHGNYLIVGKSLKEGYNLTSSFIPFNQVEFFLMLLSPKGKLLGRYSFSNDHILEGVHGILSYDNKIVVLVTYGKYRKKKGPYPNNTLLLEFSLELGLLRKMEIEGEGYSIEKNNDKIYISRIVELVEKPHEFIFGMSQLLSLNAEWEILEVNDLFPTSYKNFVGSGGFRFSFADSSKLIYVYPELSAEPGPFSLFGSNEVFYQYNIELREVSNLSERFSNCAIEDQQNRKLSYWKVCEDDILFTSTPKKKERGTYDLNSVNEGGEIIWSATLTDAYFNTPFTSQDVIKVKDHYLISAIRDGQINVFLVKENGFFFAHEILNNVVGEIKFCKPFQINEDEVNIVYSKIVRSEEGYLNGLELGVWNYSLSDINPE